MSNQPEALKLAAEYRATIPTDVMHLWARDVVVELRRLHARVQELEVLQWQPIATAPTLQDVLVFNYASEDAIVAAFDGENWHTGWEPLLRDAGKLMPLIPTHWIPLPKPPEGA